MKNTPRIVAFSGSTRRDSYNTSLLQIAALGAEQAGAQVTSINLRDYPMPLYDEDLEQAIGLPESVARLRALLLRQDGILLASPEYNGSLTGVLKNTLDWLSRPQQDGLTPFADKVALLLSASPGSMGGLRALGHLRPVLSELGVLVLAQQFALPRAHEAFNEQGELHNTTGHKAVLALGGQLVRTVDALNTATADSQRAAA